MDRPPEYGTFFSEQADAIGVACQRRIHDSRVHVHGLGRVGTQVVEGLVNLGVRHITGNDPQRLSPENFNGITYAAPGLVGQPKAELLAAFLKHRPLLSFVGIVAPNESRMVDPYCLRADVIVLTGNTIRARIAGTRKAIFYRKPVIDVSVSGDGPACYVKTWVPGRGLACPACFIQRGAELRRNGFLASTATAAAALTCNIFVSLVTKDTALATTKNNVFTLDFQAFTLDAIAVERRPDCRVCRRAA